MLPESANQQYRDQQAIAVAAAAAMGRVWGRMGDDFSESYEAIRPQLVEVMEQGRYATVNTALGYTSAVLAETGQVDAPVGEIVASRFLASTPDGRTVGGLVDQTIPTAKMAVRDGASSREALHKAGQFLTLATLTTLADTRREVYSADIIQRPTLTGYVRMLNPPSCSACTMLAGRWYRWNQGFERHDRCDCQHIPAAEDVSGDLRTDPYAYFNSLSEAEQDKLFRPNLGRTAAKRARSVEIGKRNAQAIRDGGDIYRIENIRTRGLGTSKQAVKYGTPTRYTVDDIYRIAGDDRGKAIHMLANEGYITGPQVRGGNILGRFHERFAGMTSVPRAGSARERVMQARSAGVRDPLDPATMTAAERRIYDDFYRLHYARKHGVLPNTVGVNSADFVSNSAGQKLRPGKLAELEAALNRKIARVKASDASQMRLLEELGLKDPDDYRSQVVFDRIEQLNRQRFLSSTRARERSRRR